MASPRQSRDVARKPAGAARSGLKQPILGHDNLPRPHDIDFPVRGRQHAHHAARRPVHVPPLAACNHVVALARALEQQHAVAQARVQLVVLEAPLPRRPPLARVRIDVLVGVRRRREAAYYRVVGARAVAGNALVFGAVADHVVRFAGVSIVGPVAVGGVVVIVVVIAVAPALLAKAVEADAVLGLGSLAAGPADALDAGDAEVAGKVALVDGRGDVDGGEDAVEPGDVGAELDAREEELVCFDAEADDVAAPVTVSIRVSCPFPKW